jgi:hypothetical protein
MSSNQSQFIYQNAPWICWFEKLTIKPWLLFFPVLLFYQLIIFFVEGTFVHTIAILFILVLTITPIMFLWVLNLVKRLHREIVKFDANVPSIEGIMLSRFGASVETIGAIIYALCVNFYLLPLILPEMVDAKGFVYWGGVNICAGITSLFGVHVMSLIVRASWFYMRVAEEIRISLFENKLYTFFSDLFIYSIIITLVYISGFFFTLSLLNMGSFELILFILLISSPMLAITFLPVAKIAKRIRAAKQVELEKTHQLISDEVQSLKSDKLYMNTKLMEFYNYREWLLSIWVWPFATQIQKLILFGMLPPISWFAGAYLENILGQMM